MPQNLHFETHSSLKVTFLLSPILQTENLVDIYFFKRYMEVGNTILNMIFFSPRAVKDDYKLWLVRRILERTTLRTITLDQI